MSDVGLLNDVEILDDDGDALVLAESRITGDRAVLIEVQSRCDGEIADGAAVRFDEERMRKLVAWGQAWLDAPRDAARLAAEVVIFDSFTGVRLLKTTTGEWGVRVDDGNAPGEFRVAWFAGEDAERDARRQFAAERDKALCDCGAETDPDDMVNDGEDGPDMCPRCAAESHEEWLTLPVRCYGNVTEKFVRWSEGEGEAPGCGWTGKGADAATDVDRGHACPTCGGDVELVDGAPTGEAAPA